MLEGKKKISMCHFHLQSFISVYFLAARNKTHFRFASKKKKNAEKIKKELIFKHFPLEVRVSMLTIAPHAHVTAWRFGAKRSDL